MATQYPSNRPEQGRSRTSASGGRPTGRPSNASSYGAQRPQPGRRTQPPRRRKRRAQSRFFVILLLIVVIAAAALLILKPFGGDSRDPQTTQQPVQTTAVPSATDASTDAQTDAQTASLSHAEMLAQQLGDEDSDVAALSEDEMAQVTDLSLNESLSSEWLNVLLLGSDERVISESARTDSMIICSINSNTGEVKLTSIMRDLAVDFDDIGEYSGTYRINAANYFGGEKLAMKTVNECFGLNIQYYVRVNFYGFQQIAQMLGGIDMEITEAEMEQINKLIVDQARDALNQGIDESALPNQFLENYGNVHLDGRQTLAYARIRKIDNDYARAERQRKVLSALAQKLVDMGSAEIMSVGLKAMEYFRTNMTLEQILSVALKVVESDLSNIQSFRLPINDSYKQEERKNQDMLYDCDWSANTSALHAFIYASN